MSFIKKILKISDDKPNIRKGSLAHDDFLNAVNEYCNLHPEIKKLKPGLIEAFENGEIDWNLDGIEKYIDK